jgi:hypothetical protein
MPAITAPLVAYSSTIWYSIWSMSRREVLVQLDDELVTRLDHLASERGTSRSELLRRGAIAVLEAADLRRADDDLQGAYRRIPQDPDIVQMASRLAAATMPEW